MGPITLFDKSFLESLNPDEAVWFDQFYSAIISPLFYAETLADLEKEIAEGRSQEQVVGSIAYRTPVLHSSPVAHYKDICISSLLGQEIPMDGRVPRAGGRMVEVDGQAGLIYEEAPEIDAMYRWQEGKFIEIERNFAKGWRQGLRKLDLEKDGKLFKPVWSGTATPKNLENAKALADEIIGGIGREYNVLRTSFDLFEVPSNLQLEIGRRWEQAGRQSLPTFAPYAAYVLSIDFFFYLAIAGGLISPNRSSNRIDIAYLYYLPFSMVFVSNDKLHRRTAPLYLRDDQEFVWGQDLKKDLGDLNSHFSSYSSEEKDSGVMRFASRPPLEGDYLTTKLWDRLLSPVWRKGSDAEKMEPPSQDPELVARLRKFSDTEISSDVGHPIDLEEIENMTIKRRVPSRRGKWQILPPGIKGE